MLIWWTEKLATGIKAIDEDHKEIIDMLNHLHNAMSKKDAKEDVALVLTSLAVYVRKHFSSEEAIMAKIGYPYLDRQKKAHRTLLRKVQSLLQKQQRGDTPSVREMVAFLQDWLTNHIEKEDLKIGEYYRAWQNASKQQAAKKAAAGQTGARPGTAVSETASRDETAVSGDKLENPSEEGGQTETSSQEVVPRKAEAEPLEPDPTPA